MRKIREVLRLSALGLKQHQIARSCSIVQSTVYKYLKRAEAAQLRWPLPQDLNDQKLDHLLFGQRTAPPSRRLHPPPDFVAIHRELEGHKELTLELLWQEYRQANPEGYGYSRFCDLYREWRRNQSYTLLEAAARRALHFGTHSVASVESILQHHLENEPLPGIVPTPTATLAHANIRGAAYFEAIQ